jgi:glycerophosphoryl diester phosphodiesterase
MTWADLQRRRFVAHPEERIPLLEELSELLKPSHLSLRLELKVGPEGDIYSGITETVLALLAEQAMLERTLVSSFDTRYLEAVGRLRPGLHRIWLIRPRLQEEIGVEAVIGQARALGIPEVDLRAETLQDDWPQRFAEADLMLGAFAAGERHTIERALSLGVAMFTTDRPDLAISIRDER